MKTYNNSPEAVSLLTQEQYRVTHQHCTERLFQNEYMDNKEQGPYVDVASGEPLFSSADKFASGTGWPSFTKPLEPEKVVENVHRGALLGHIFPDGSPEGGGLRYCINSASQRFMALNQRESEAYGDYTNLLDIRSKE